MTSQSDWIGGFCRLYSVMLYAYPDEFRRAYGGDMRRHFRDRCRDLARHPGRPRIITFAAHVVSDWVRTAVRERAAAMKTSGVKPVKASLVTEWAGTILIYLFATTTLVQAYVVPTGSMEGPLRVGDHMLVDRMAYAEPGSFGRRILPYRDVQRGDIVAFLYPEDVRQTYVKRVIGLPGDHIRLENRQVIRNGRRLVEPYTQYVAPWADAYRDNFPLAPEALTTPRGRDMFARYVRNGELIVPPDTLFVLGDNRDNSADSRYWGLVPRRNVVGKPLLVYWSYDAPTEQLTEWTLDHVLDVGMHFFSRTRWNRTLLVPRSQSARDGGVQ
jgi:signal peptidase I